MAMTLFTLTGVRHYYGTEFLAPGARLKLVKEPDNQHDREAIRVELNYLGKIGYVANSHCTVRGESMSAGRLYDRIGDTAEAEVLLVVHDFAICTVCSESLLEDSPVLFIPEEVDPDDEPGEDVIEYVLPTRTHTPDIVQ